MMGERRVQEALFYEFSLEQHVPADHLLRSIDRFVDLSGIREHLRPFYSETGRPSVDPELLIRMLIVGYCFAIRSERRLCEEVHLNLAYRWFCRLGLDGDVPDHSTFSKNRHGRFRDSDLLRRLFETVLQRCIGEGLVGGEGFAVDASLIQADASDRTRLEDGAGLPPAAAGRAVEEYLAVLDDAAFGAATEVTPKYIAPADPATRWTAAHRGPAFFAYSANYLIDTDNAIIVDVEATTAIRQAEVLAAKRMVERSRRDSPASLAPAGPHHRDCLKPDFFNGIGHLLPMGCDSAATCNGRKRAPTAVTGRGRPSPGVDCQPCTESVRTPSTQGPRKGMNRAQPKWCRWGKPGRSSSTVWSKMAHDTMVNPDDRCGTATELDALVIGAGFAGLYQLLCLRDRLGLSVRAVEAGGGVGGTWYWNRYPGARCDSESHVYWYTFSPELMREWEWSERYPGQAEILRYLKFVADRFDLKKDIRFNTRVVAAHYDEAANRWRVRTEHGETFVVRFLIGAVGCLSTANVPQIPGLEDFAGDWYHTGQWPHEGVDFTGKRVGMIGTGSTGIQAAPVIAASAKHLTVFQRTANYSVPARNVPLSAEFRQYIKDHASDIRAITHETLNGMGFRIEERLAVDTPPEERERIYEAAWERGGLQFRAAFQDMLTDKRANDTAADFIKRKIRSIVNDPKTAAILSDIDHPYAAKRPPIDTDYFETYNRPNVSLVDLRNAPIDRISRAGICTTEAEYPVDIIVFATGFDAMTGPMLRIDIRGRDGMALKDAWASGPLTYLGLQVAGFPNLFTITGPGSPSVLCNMPVAIEQHADWITDCIKHLNDNGLESIEASPEAADKWVAEVNEVAEKTVFPMAKHSWYLGANIPGKPRVFMPYAGGMVRYRQICADVAARGYEGFMLS